MKIKGRNETRLHRRAEQGDTANEIKEEKQEILWRGETLEENAASKKDEMIEDAFLHQRYAPNFNFHLVGHFSNCSDE